MAKKVGIEIEVDSKGAVTSFRQLGKSGEEATKKIDKGSKEATKSLNLLATVGIAGAVAGTFKLGKGVIELSDQYSLLRSQIKLVIDEGNSLDSIQKKLLDVSNETRQSVKATTELYTKLDRATKELALSDEKVIDLVETLNKAFIISGASAEESANGVRQLSQAIQGGILRAEEYNSIIEQTPRIAELFADSLNVTQGEFRKLVIEGKVTTQQLIGAIQEQTIAINQEFGKIEKTSGQTWTVLTNNVESYITQLSVVKDAQTVFNSLLENVNKLFESQAGFDATQRAKETDLQNRSLEQQFLVLNDIKRLQDSALQQSDQRQAALLKERIEAELGVITVRKRIAAEEELRKKRAEDKADEAAEAERNAQLAALAELEKAADERNLIVDQALQEQTAIYNIRNEERREAEQQAEIEFLKKNFEEQQKFEARNSALKAKSAENSRKLAKETADFEQKLQLQTASMAVDALREVFGENKAFASADIIINTARGIQRSFADLPPPFNGIQAGIIGASGVAQLAKVNGAKFADGTEFVQGPGSNRSDSVPAMLSRGERVVDAQTNAELGGVSNADLLSAVRGNGGGVNVTVNAGVGSDGEAIAQMVVNAIEEARVKGLEPSIV